MEASRAGLLDNEFSDERVGSTGQRTGQIVQHLPDEIPGAYQPAEIRHTCRVASGR